MRRVASPIPPRRAVVEVALVGAKRMRELNRTYRGGRGVPQVLTFSYADGPRSIPDGGDPLGEIVLCWPSVVAGARARGVPAGPYAVRLLVHGLMHLRGYRHDDERSERTMERAERRRLRGFLGETLLAALFS